MKLKYKTTILMLFSGIFVLIILSIIYDLTIHSKIEKQEILSLERQAEGVTQHIENHLTGKSNTVKTLSAAPILKTQLIESNKKFAELNDDDRNMEIDTLNRKWKETRNPKDPFIQSYMNNPAADYLKIQQNIFPAEYGEIFLTNHYGAIIATTNKLTTLAHSHKYWWKAAYNNGNGRVFIDDRGFDNSVEGYVLGIVVPVMNGDEIIGILKCNVNIMAALKNIVDDYSTQSKGILKIVRTNGRIVLEKDIEPLSMTLPDKLIPDVQNNVKFSRRIKENDNDWLIASSPIKLTMGSKDIGFGGSYESIDHLLGNTGECWHAMLFTDNKIIHSLIHETTSIIFFSGFILITFLTFITLIIGKKIAAPIEYLSQTADKIGKGNLEMKANVLSNDEIGSLSDSINNMTKNLKTTMASRDELALEVESRKKAEKEKEEVIAQLENTLKEVKTLRGFIPICASCKNIRDKEGYWNKLEAYISSHSEAEFSHSLCPTCAKRDYPEYFQDE